VPLGAASRELGGDLELTRGQPPGRDSVGLDHLKRELMSVTKQGESGKAAGGGVAKGLAPGAPICRLRSV